MKKKFAVILLSAALGAAMLSGCGGTDRGTGKKISHEQENEDAVYGEVSEVAEDTITIKVGTRKEMERPENGYSGKKEMEKPENGYSGKKEMEKPESGSLGKQEEGQSGERPSMLDLTGEEQEITITKDTVIKRQNMGGAPGNGDALQKPDGEPSEGSGTDQRNSSEEIAVSDISEGDVIMVTFAEDKNAAEITVLSAMGGGRENVNPPVDGQDSEAGMV